MKQKVLVLHPDDRSTDFLKSIYKNIKCTVITEFDGNIGALIKKAKNHDRIIMLGHGTPWGLLGFGWLFNDEEFVGILREKSNNVYIWCNADKYVRPRALKGFFSGMFISEVGEAYMYNIRATQGEINFSNALFANILGEIIHYDSPLKIQKEIKALYQSGVFPAVTSFNNERLYAEEVIKETFSLKKWFKDALDYFTNN